MKKLSIVLGFIVTFLLMYFLQVNFFSWFNLAGIKPNLFVIFVLFIGLFSGKSTGTAFGIFFGIILDFLVGKSVGIYAFSLGLIGFMGGYLDQNFSKDSRVTMLTMTVLATLLYEVMTYALYYFIHATRLQVAYFIQILLLEIIFHSFITIICYPLMIKFGYKVEENFKESQILTRYF